MDRSELSPLQEIERRVQERAGDLAVDMADDGGQARLRALVDDEVAAWSRDFKRGLRAYDLADPELVATRAFRNLAGYGPLEPLLADDDVWEIMINGPDQIFVKRHHGPSSYHDEVFNDDDHVVRTLTKILDDASGSHRKLDPAEGLQDAQLDTGARLHIVHGDVGRDGHTLVNIRKFTGIPFRALGELVELDMLDSQVADFLRACVRSRLSMVFSGAPGSGKTTLLSCCAAELDPTLRVVIAEEVFEADLPLPNVASMQTRPARQDRPAVDLRRLVSGFLRMAPDIAVVGEVRDREGLPRRLCSRSQLKLYRLATAAKPTCRASATHRAGQTGHATGEERITRLWCDLQGLMKTRRPRVPVMTAASRELERLVAIGLGRPAGSVLLDILRDPERSTLEPRNAIREDQPRRNPVLQETWDLLPWKDRADKVA